MNKMRISTKRNKEKLEILKKKKEREGVKVYHIVIYIKGNSISLKMLIMSNQNFIDFFLPSVWILFL